MAIPASAPKQRRPSGRGDRGAEGEAMSWLPQIIQRDYGLFKTVEILPMCKEAHEATWTIEDERGFIWVCVKCGATTKGQGEK